uniref:Lipase n=2 Tax=Parascaris univalens TaxID=6257 RepID=A0A915BVJ1_PARUN
MSLVASSLVITVLFGFSDATSVGLPEAAMTTPQIIRHHGYPAEVHHITTEDGYILEMHRIPFSKQENGRQRDEQKPVVLLQHGFIGSSAVWVTNLVNQSAGFLFADAGFDVWMGNARGNTYSVGHVKYSRSKKEYWAFTWDDISEYDLPAMIDYALNVTNERQLYYVGYSEGTLTMFAKLASDQSFTSKIRKFFALGPIGTVTYIKGLIRSAAKNFMRPLTVLARFSAEFMANDSLFRKMSKATCSLSQIVEHCENLMFQMTGPATSQMNQTRIPIYMTHLPAGTSTANLVHWAQMVNSRNVQKYDFGSKSANMRHYGSEKPPVFNLTLVNAPVYLYWSDADWLADKRDVEEGLLAVIPKRYIIENNQLQNFNHFDFIWGIRAAEEIYIPIINTIKDDHEIIVLQ